MEWKQVSIDPVRKNVYGCPSICSKNRIFGAYFIVKIINIRSNSQNMEVRCVCKCSTFLLKCTTISIPPKYNSTIFWCNRCKEPIMRIIGFTQGDWKMEIPS